MKIVIITCLFEVSYPKQYISVFIFGCEKNEQVLYVKMKDFVETQVNIAQDISR